MGGSGCAGEGRCERRSEVFVKIQKKKKQIFGGGGGVGLGGIRVHVNEELKFFLCVFFWGGSGWGSCCAGEGRCERRSEVFVKIKTRGPMVL